MTIVTVASSIGILQVSSLSVGERSGVLSTSLSSRGSEGEELVVALYKRRESDLPTLPVMLLFQYSHIGRAIATKK